MAIDESPGETAAPAARAGAPRHTKRRRPSAARSAVEWIVIIAGALLVAFVVRTFLLQAFFIPSGSMEPTLEVHDRVLVNKLSYKLHDVHRGDIVVFKRPPNETGDARIKDLIKRVVGLPGETIESRDGVVFVNDRQVDERYLPAGVRTIPEIRRQVVPAGTLFVMGDNRTNSQDSRYIGPISEDLVVGRAFVRVWPLGQLGSL